MNSYDVSGQYGIGYTSDGREFYFDLEDYDKIKSYTWCVKDKNTCGYIVSQINKKMVRLHRFILGELCNNMVVDHINHDTLDNRKENLRICTQHQNTMNNSLSINNTSGHAGVSFIKRLNKWRAYIMINRKQVNLGCFENIQDAILIRKEAEEKYFGEYRSKVRN